jgi:hypothetical protein
MQKHAVMFVLDFLDRKVEELLSAYIEDLLKNLSGLVEISADLNRSVAMIAIGTIGILASRTVVSGIRVSARESIFGAISNELLTTNGRSNIQGL